MAELLISIKFAVGAVVGFFLFCILLYILTRVITSAILYTWQESKRRSEDHGAKRKRNAKGREG